MFLTESDDFNTDDRSRIHTLNLLGSEAFMRLNEWSALSIWTANALEVGDTVNKIDRCLRLLGPLRTIVPITRIFPITRPKSIYFKLFDFDLKTLF
jgi:hypothetical protein